MVYVQRAQDALLDRLFVCGDQARIEGDVIMCFLNLQYHVVWAETHNITPNAFCGEYPINIMPHNIYHS